MIEVLRLEYPVPVLCQVLEVSESGYYARRSRPESKRARDDRRFEAEIRAAHERTRQTYGAERLRDGLAGHNVHIGVCRIKRLRKKLGIRCKQKRKFRATTDSGPSLPVADNLLGQRFSASAPNQVWLSDITFILTGEGWLYLAGHRDMFT